MKLLRLIGASVCLVVFSSCQMVETPSTELEYRIDRKRYEALTSDQSRIKISLWDQKAWLLNERDEPVLETDIATGVPGKETPQGVFPILEKIESKRSNRYGRYVNKETREVVVAKAWEHVGKPPEGTEYEGISMPYWMRLTWYGVGMHVGEFPKRTRSSFGCIRVFEDAQPLIYRKAKIGTEVEVVSQSLVETYGLKRRWW